MRKRKAPETNTASGCFNCSANPLVTINGLCPHCHSYLEAFKRHRPVFNRAQFKEWLEYLEGIQVELKGMCKEAKRDKDLHRFLTATFESNQHAIDAMKDRIRDGRNF